MKSKDWVQVAPAARVSEQFVPWKLNCDASVPETVPTVTVNEIDEEFVSVTIPKLPLPTAALPNATALGLTVSAATSPVPVRETVELPSV